MTSLIPELPAVMPKPGEYTAEYQAYLDGSVEEIITKVVRFKMLDMATQKPLSNVEMEIWRCDGYDYSTLMLVSIIRADANGEGSFTIDMPKSFFEKTMQGVEGKPRTNSQFIIAGADTMREHKSMSNRVDATVDGVDYVALADGLSHFYVRDNNPRVMELRFMTWP